MPNDPSIIARPTPTGWEGRYIHNDGHPDQRVPLLFDLYHRVYRHDLNAMTRYLIDDHPAGWSQLGDDPTTDTGWHNAAPPTQRHGFICYCHGDRNEAAQLHTQADTDPALADAVFVIHPDGIEVIEANWNTEDGGWEPGYRIPWNTSSCPAAPDATASTTRRTPEWPVNRRSSPPLARAGAVPRDVPYPHPVDASKAVTDDPPAEGHDHHRPARRTTP